MYCCCAANEEQAPVQAVVVAAPAVGTEPEDHTFEEAKREEEPRLVEEPLTFEVQLDTTKDSIGMVVDPRAGTLMVTGVNSGAVQKHNESVEATHQVQPRDFVVEVNGTSDPKAMLKELTTKGSLKLRVHRAVPFKAVVSKAGRALGMKLAFVEKSKTIGVVGILDGAVAVTKYNEIATPDSQIKVGDRIISVCGVEGDAKKMVAALGADETVELMIARVNL